MPISRNSRPVIGNSDDGTPAGLRPYIHHGIALAIQNGHGVGDCPFPRCGGAGKFSVDCESGLWRCWVCGGGTDSGGGNALTFLRLFHAAAVEATPPNYYAFIAHDRSLCSEDTPRAWGVCRSPVAPYPWLVAGYAPDGRLDQLYKRTQMLGSDGRWSWRLLPTPGVWPEGRGHALHLPPNDLDPTCPEVYVCEGPWDAMALWEVARGSKIAPCQVIAAPGCNVWRDEWTEFCRGKSVTVLYDNDHPNLQAGRQCLPGYEGMRRVAKRLSGIAATVRWLKWGEDGWNPAWPSGWDVRDHLSRTLDMVTGKEYPVPARGRRSMLDDLLTRVAHAPAEWFSATHTNGAAHGSGSADVEPEDCDNWAKCEAAWQVALEWRDELADVTVVMLAVAASTNQSGDNQLFLQVIGDPGSAKTRLCKGLLVSQKCKLLLHLKSFHSGWKQWGEEEKDCSLVARINGLCLVTPEADALHVGMNLDQINSQVRQIFDGESGNTYGNSDKDRHYKGLRSPWIQAGTPALMDKDQSRLGDRFLRIRLEQPDEEVKQAILLQALRNERQAVLETSNGTASSIIPPKLRQAYALTGGYVDWLRAHIEEMIGMVEMDGEADQRCIDLAMLTADARARPNMDPRKTEVHHTKELPSRLVSQFCRLALCLAVTLNRGSVDAEVMRIVRKVALDTAHGHTLNIIRWLCSRNPKAPGETYQSSGGLGAKCLEMWTNMSEERLVNYLLFLRKIGILELVSWEHRPETWILTERVYDLYLRIMRS